MQKIIRRCHRTVLGNYANTVLIKKLISQIFTVKHIDRFIVVNKHFDSYPFKLILMPADRDQLPSRSKNIYPVLLTEIKAI